MTDTMTEQPTQVAPEAASVADLPPTFTCPDCGRVFTSKQGLGRHRTSAHGANSTRSKTRKRRAKVVTRKGVTRDALLKAVLPNGGGLPANADLLDELAEWLRKGVELSEALAG